MTTEKLRCNTVEKAVRKIRQLMADDRRGCKKKIVAINPAYRYEDKKDLSPWQSGSQLTGWERCYQVNTNCPFGSTYCLRIGSVCDPMNVLFEIFMEFFRDLLLWSLVALINQ